MLCGGNKLTPGRSQPHGLLTRIGVVVRGKWSEPDICLLHGGHEHRPKFIPQRHHTVELEIKPWAT